MKKTILLSIITLIGLAACNNSEKKQIITKNQSFFVGTYTNGESKGIYKYSINNEGKLDSIGLAAETPDPSFLAFSPDKKYLIAVGEISREDDTGLVCSFKIEKDQLRKVSERTSGGAHPCFIACNENGYTLTANYTGGSVALHKLNENGELSPLLDLQIHIGEGTTDRQKSPHVHSAWFVPNSTEILIADLGTNDLWIYHLDTIKNILVPADQKSLSSVPGAGPRHLAFHPSENWIYLVNELDCTVSLVKKNKKNNYFIERNISTLPVDYTENNTCADIHISQDGHFLYASNRGHNSIAIFSIDQNNGTLQHVAYQAVFGETPRNFAISPCGNFLLVANQNSENIVSFKRDNKSGMLTKIDNIAAPKPVCIKF